MANEVSIYEPRHLIEVVRTTPPLSLIHISEPTRP